MKSYIICFISLFLLFSSYVFAKDVKPTFVLETRGFVKDFLLEKTTLYVANDAGTVEIFDLKKLERVDEIVLPLIKTVQDKLIPPVVLSIDRYENKTLIVSSAMKGYRNVWLHDGMNLKKVISQDKKQTITKAHFLDNDNFIFGTISNEIIIYNNVDSFNLFKKHIEQSTMSDMKLNKEKTKMVTASESGRVNLVDVKTGTILTRHESLNVDNVFKVDYKNGTIITAGKDRRVGVYPKKGEPYYLKSDFLVYSAALSPNGEIGIYSSGESNNLQVFDIKTKKKLRKLIGHYAVPSNIKFINEKELFSAGDENKIFYWKLY